MRALVISRKAGQGHRSAAEAVEEALSQECLVRHETLFDRSAAIYNRLGNKTLREIGDKLPRLLESCFPNLVSLPLYHVFERTVPHVVVSVNRSFNSLVELECIRRGVPLITVPTDADHAHFIAGMRRPRLVTRYPVRKCFEQQQPWDGADSPHIVLGNYTTVVDDVRTLRRNKAFNDVDIHVLCGMDARRARKLAAEQHGKCFVHGQIRGDKVAAMLQNAQVFVTKPGGASVAEGMASNCAMVFKGSVPSWERANAHLAVSQHPAIWCQGAICDAVLSVWNTRAPFKPPAESFKDALMKTMRDAL